MLYQNPTCAVYIRKYLPFLMFPTVSAIWSEHHLDIFSCSIIKTCSLYRVRAAVNVISFTTPIFRGGSRIFERGGLIIKKLYSKSVHGALIKYHFGSSRNDASLCAHKLIQV